MISNHAIAMTSILLMLGVLANRVLFANTKLISQPIERPMIQKIEIQNPQLSRAALMAGVRAYVHLRQVRRNLGRRLTIVDFSRPSNKKRLWVLNMANGDTNYFTYVTHGEKSGLNKAKHFSNVVGSHESSIGVYITGHSYYGIKGYSLRLLGLDKGFNTNVFKRHIVMHSAWYVSQRFAKHHGRLGRTNGCFGLSRSIAYKIISTIKNGTVVVAYYPNKHWLKNSPYEQPITT